MRAGAKPDRLVAKQKKHDGEEIGCVDEGERGGGTDGKGVGHADKIPDDRGEKGGISRALSSLFTKRGDRFGNGIRQDRADDEAEKADGEVAFVRVNLGAHD